MALGALGLISAIGRRLWDERTGWAAALLFALSPVTLYYAKNANLDIPYVFWLALALFFYVRILQENRRRDYLWLGLSAALAVCTKDQAYGFILLMPVVLLFHLRAKLALPLREFLPRALHFAGPAALGFAVPFVAIHNILFDPAGFWRACPGRHRAGVRRLAPVLGRSGRATAAAGRDGAAPRRCMDLGGPGAGAFRPRRRFQGRRGEAGAERRLATLVPVLSYHLSFLAVIGYVYPRFVLPMLLVLALFAGRGAVVLWRGGRLGRIAAVALIAWIGLAGLCVDYVMSEYPRYDAQKWLETHATAETRIFYVTEQGHARHAALQPAARSASGRADARGDCGAAPAGGPARAFVRARARRDRRAFVPAFLDPAPASRRLGIGPQRGCSMVEKMRTAGAAAA